MPTEMEQFVAACDYPGLLDVPAVEAALGQYCKALGVERKIVRLEQGWELQDHPSLARYVDRVLKDFGKRNPEAALAALDALDARAALTSLHRFAAWCVQAYGWWWWRFDLSYLSCTHFGAIQNNKPDVLKWTQPVLHAYLSGCWMLHWTDDTLYWVSKPTVHVERVNGAKRLHNEQYAALESDVENIYFWHGVMVPAFVVVRPDWITVSQTHRDGRQRRSAARDDSALRHRALHQGFRS